MRTKYARPSMLVGGSTLLVILAALCLTVFALLTLSAVQADARLQQASAQAVTAYYEAEKQAETILAQLRRGVIPENVTERDGVYSYSSAISETQSLLVEVVISPDQYQILRWQVVQTAAWEPETELPVWDGEQ